MLDIYLIKAQYNLLMLVFLLTINIMLTMT